MLSSRLPLILTSIILGSPAAIAAPAAAIVVEAESGALGASFTTATDGGVTYLTDPSESTALSPGSAERVAGYTVDFPEPGVYDLFARIRVGPETFNDDSFLYGKGFGDKSPADPDDWVLANGTANAGFTAAGATVTGGGSAGAQVWKWIKLSEFEGGGTPIQFTVLPGELTRTFQIGSRENGMWIDKFAFGSSAVIFTVANLDNGTPGIVTTAHAGPPLAAGKPKFLGNVWSSAQLPNFTLYWNQVTPENAGKWGSVEGTRNAMNWGQLDAAYALAKNNGFPFRFHVLVWGNQQPAWIESLPAAEQLAEIRQWFEAVAARYPDIDYLEVVNEPLHDPPRGAGNGNYIDALGGDGETGWDWVLTSFRLAREIFPASTQLMINDYSVTNSTQSMQNYRTIIQLLQAEDLIDCIGIQAHAFETTVNPSTTRNNLNALAATGLPVQVTEMDIDGPTEQTQLESYQSIFPIFWEHPSVIGVTLWGWRDGMWRTDQGAPLVRTDGVEKPAFQWLRAYVQNHLPVIPPDQSIPLPAGAPNGSTVGHVLASDGDEDTVLVDWTITSGNGGGRFAIDPATGRLSVANAGLLGTAGVQYPLTLTVGDGLGTSVPANVTVRVIVPDSDNDGMPDDFELLHSGSATGLDPELDGDGDGIPAFYEFIFGLRPDEHDPDGAPFVGITGTGGEKYLTLTYRLEARASDYLDLQVLRASDSLDPGAWQAGATVLVSDEEIPGESGVRLITERSIFPLTAQPAEFLRLEAIPRIP